jgi:hypothetical protein
MGRVGKVRPSLDTMARKGLWPTTTTDSKASGAAGYSTESGRHSGTTLTDAAVRTPTWASPVARDWKDGTDAITPVNGYLGRQVLRMPLAGESTSETGRVLNPLFTEALMGWSPGWTASASAATESSRTRRPSHSEPLRVRLAWALANLRNAVLNY